MLAARELDLQARVMVLNPTIDEDAELSCEGNLLLNRLAGAKLITFPTRTDITRAEHLKIIHERMKDYAQKLRYFLKIIGCVHTVHDLELRVL